MSTQVAVKGEQDLYMDPKTGVYYGQVYLIKADGTRKRKIKTLKTKDLKKARIELRKLTARLMVQKKQESGLRKLIKDEWPIWIELGKNTGWRPRTYADVELHGRLHLLPYFGDEFVESVTLDSWENYIAFQWEKTPGRKLKLHGDYLTMFLHHCLRKELIEKVPVLRNPDSGEEVGKRYSRKELARLLWNARPISYRARGAKPGSKQNVSRTIQLIVLMGYKQGNRRNEVVRLQKDRIDWEARMIRLRPEDVKTGRKTGKGRSIPIHPVVYSRLKRQCELHPDSKFVFPHRDDPKKAMDTMKTAWSGLKKRAKVKGRFHDLRHTCASEMADRGVQTTIAAKILGMSAIVFEKTYCKPSEEALTKAMGK